jgi:hypothetical protein
MHTRGVQCTAGVVAGFAIVRHLSQISSLGGRVSSSSGKGKKPPKAPRVDKSSQSVRPPVKQPKNPLYVLRKLSLPKIIQEKHDLGKPTLKR